MSPVDLRSDTVTKPTPAMREAMRTAEVGNAAWGEDPTVNSLEARCAELMGKEAACFVPSGTMGNQTAVRAWTACTVAPEVILHERSHLYLNEAAGLATVSGAQARPLPGEGGRLDPEAVEAAMEDGTVGVKPRTALLALENTHNYAGGTVVPLALQEALGDVARAHDLPVHLDGARVWNAAAALEVPAARVVRDVDSVQFCFSKGLACPVGSMVAGPADFIADVRKVRQYLGGAMRQAGVLAACAHVALDEVLPLLPRDHERAARLATGLRDTPLAFREPETNILVLDASATRRSAPELAREIAKRDVLLSVISEHELRAVTHVEIRDEDVERAVEVVRAVVGA